MTIPGILDALEGLYGSPRALPSHDPVAELVLTILSQNTADTNSGRAFVRLMREFCSWDEVADAPLERVIAAIQPGGLAPQKAPRLQTALRSVRERWPDWDLGQLSNLPVEEARAWLMSLNGVGPKTAACVLLFALGLPALPVDTHVERVSKRLELIPPNVSADKAHTMLEDLVEKSQFYRFHMLFIKHGRRTCIARRPACERCPLASECPSSLVQSSP